MKTFFLPLCLLAALPLAGAVAEAPKGLRITYDMAGLPLTVTKDTAGTLQLDGLPYPGIVLYRPQTGVLYYQHPDTPEWLTLAPADFQHMMQEGTYTQGPAWQPWPAQGTPQPTRRWDVEARPETGDKTACEPVFASTYAARMAGVTVMDINRILAALEWLNAGAIAQPCDAVDIGAAQAEKVGLPVVMTGPNGRWQLQDIVQDDVPPIALPTGAQPVDDNARLTLLLVQFGPAERADFLKKYGNLPVARQVEVISQQLVQDAQP